MLKNTFRFVLLTSVARAQIVLITWANTQGGEQDDCLPTPTNVIGSEVAISTTCTSTGASGSWIKALSTDSYATYSDSACTAETWNSASCPSVSLAMGSCPMAYGECYKYTPLANINLAFQIRPSGYETCPADVWTSVASGDCVTGTCPQNVVDLICASDSCKAYLEGLATTDADKPSVYCVASQPCFPSSATVTKDGTTVRVDSLVEGDVIVAATADGTLTTDTVSVLSIAKPEATATFITLTTSTGTLALTAEHHLPVGPACCSTLKKAGDVEVGETVWSIGKSVGAAPAATVVVKKAEVKSTGLHSPVLTNGGFPVVDGHVTSFDKIEKVTLASYGLRYLELACKMTGTCGFIRGVMG